MIDIRIIDSLSSIRRMDWNDCFAGMVEDYDYLLAAETAGIQGFQWYYLTAWDSGKLLAAIPAFFTDYALDTTLDGGAKKVVSILRRFMSKMLTLKLACLGSPVTEYGVIGFHPDVLEAERANLLRQMVQHFETYAFQHGCNTVGLKDILRSDETLWQSVFSELNYQQVAGQPSATLAIPFANIEQYFAALSPATRKNMRRKLRARDQLRIEHRTSVDDVLPRIMALYHATHARANMQFEELTAAYFQNVLSHMPDRAFCTLYYAGDELLAANLILQDGSTLLDKYFCMETERGREFNLYFISWFTNLEYCLAHGLRHYQSGQAGYETKLRLGSSLEHTFIGFKHRNRFVQGALKLAAPLLTADTMQEAV